MATPQVKDLVLRSPAGGEDVTYTWPLQIGSGSDRHDNGIDIIETIRHVCEDIPEINSAFESFSFNDVDTTCHKAMTLLVDRFNKTVEQIRELEKGTSLPAQRLNKFASPCLLRHIIQLVYNAAVSDPDKLNQYEPFSPEVYGETSYDLVYQMIEQVEVKAEDVFIDLGSGVGQVVLQMAGSSPLKACIGIERAEVPSRYAELMDVHFRLWMNWFGKKYGEYQLIKGDFLADEHREKINSASIVFVNNFAFGPAVDHQLKERFADLKDGARIVSSKSFCPLNFRITDRNLSDIGTIMYVRELSPLKGSVSWTGKPVSYYLHVIDRTKLECYFQRLKSQKAAETDNVGSNTRSSRDRAKREATKSHMDESSSESDGAIGPTTRRAWSDWCSSKGKSSQSDDEENNNFSTNSARPSNTRSAAQQKKRKKLTRKAASNQKDEKSTNIIVEKKQQSNNQQKRGRIKKGRGRRNLKIVGLDVLHQETLLSTNVELMCKKLPPAPGCVDQQLTSLTGDMCHEELEIPTAPSDTPYALQILLDMYRSQFMQALEQMKSKGYKENVSKQIEREKERNQRLLNRASQLEKQIKVLIDDSVALLKARMNELGISMTSQNDLLAKAKEIVGRHKELQVMAAKLQNQVNCIEQEQKSLVMKQVQGIVDKGTKIKNENLELTPATSHELVLKEIANTLSQRKKLHAQVTTLEQEILLIEKAAEERKNAVVMLNQQNTHLTVTSIPPGSSHSSSSSTLSKSSSSSHSKSRRNREHRSRSQEWPDVPDVGKIEENNPEILAQKILETGRQIEAGKFANNNACLSNANSTPSSKSKEDRKHSSNHHSHHSGDSALMPAPACGGTLKPGNQTQHHSQQPQQIKATNVPKNFPLNPTPNRIESASSTASKIIQESPKVVNFEDRLKSIITSVLNEDQEQRKAAQQVERKTPQQTGSIYGQGNKGSSNLLSVSTQGLTLLNSSTTISPVNPASFTANNSGAVCNSQSQLASHGYKQSQQSSASLYNVGKSHQPHPTSTPVSAHATPNMSNIQKFFAKTMPLNNVAAAFAGASHGALGGGHQNTTAAMLYATQQQVAPELVYRRSLEHGEFKAPDNLRYDKVGQQFEENIRSNSASSDSALYYNSSSSRAGAGGDRNILNGQQQQHLQQPPSRPSSGSSQPDYTQVSPAKMALRRHLSQEKLNQHVQHPLGGAATGSMMSSKTIGDLVNGEIERTLEISHQSIINAAVNMSTVGAQGTLGSSGSMINPNAQRPERVNVRIPEDHGLVMNPAFSPISRPSSCELRKSPVHTHGQSNLATLAQVAYNHKMMTQQQPNMQPNNSERSGNSAPPSSTSRSRSSYSNSSNSAALYQQQQQQQQSSSRSSSSSREQYTHVALPRAEMKPYLSSYFTDDQKPPVEERSSRMMNGNPPPFEGLAASLHARVIATLNIKQEKDDKHRRNDVHYSNPSSSTSGSIIPTQIKTESGLKRTSPIVQHPRPAKMPHYSDVHDQIHINDLSSHSGGRRSAASMEPPLMSPEINSLTSEDRASIVGSRSGRSGSHFLKQRNEDDDLPEDESHWQDRISSGFDRLVAFASTELDKTRRSIENDTAPSVSCNTSPDSGITHGSNGDTRTFLSSSSSSSQLDIVVSGSGSTTGRSSSLSDRRSDSTKCVDTVPIIKTSPPDVIDSPPLSEAGLPRTPSPSPATPPLLPIVGNTSNSLVLSSSCSEAPQTHQSTLRIPLKYQRQSSEKHYKKKFRERRWEYNYDDYGYGSSNQRDGESRHHSNSPVHHKSSKFRPKGKDWDWSHDGKMKGNRDDPTAA